MYFKEKLNEYMETISCTAKELGDISGISAATLSRYRSGERVPDMNSDAFSQLCKAIAQLSRKKRGGSCTKESVREEFLKCADVIVANKECLCQNFNTLVTVLNMSVTKLCQYISYDSSTVSRFRNGTRQPSEPVKFATAVSEYVAVWLQGASERNILAELLLCSVQELEDKNICQEKIKNWLLTEKGNQGDDVSAFLTKLDEFDLNEYIKVIHFDEMKLPLQMPFQLPTSKAYFGLKEMMESEIDFLKATVLSKSNEEVIMYSDMPMGEMAKDPEFPKKWMFGMAMMLKKGLHLNQIHNLDRSFEDMMLGLESWIPMYMTGQVSPFYLKNVQNNVFLHFLKVSGAAALTGEGIAGYHENGKYYLTKSKEEISYYQKRARELLSVSCSLMDIYREERKNELRAFVMADAYTGGERRNRLSSLPVYTLSEETLKKILNRHRLPENGQHEILTYAEMQRKMMREILKGGTVEDEFPPLSEEEFKEEPMRLCLSEIFNEGDIVYTYEEYQEHLMETRRYEKEHPGYIFVETKTRTFHNLQIHIHQGQWVMVSKGNAPAIHFVIHHPRLCEAIENFVPPMIE